MQSRLKKNLILLLYAWLIYNTYFFTLALFIIPHEGLSASLHFMALSLSFSHVVKIFWEAISSLSAPDMLGIGYILFSAGFTLCLFWKRQTLMRAWFLAMAGICASPYILPYNITYSIDSRAIRDDYAIICVNLLYFLLIVGNHLQKNHWPDNKLANRLREILKWPCIRT